MGIQGEGGELDTSVNAKTSFSLLSASPHFHLKRQSSQPLFLFNPGLVGFS